MEKIKYMVITGEKGFADFEKRVSEALNDAWEPVGGLAFNAGFAYQAVAKLVKDDEEKKPAQEQTATKTSTPRKLTANEAMRRIDELT